MKKNIVIIATRKSPLALWQANYVKEILQQQWPDLKIKLLPMKTSGDRFLQDKLQSLGGKGLFVKELEEALLDKRADLAVHSMKDVPAELPAGLSLATICKRHNPLDAYLSVHYPCFSSLPKYALIGTSSLRRQSQLLAWRPDLSIQPLRGNIQTRIKKMQDGGFDGIILAVSGLERMGLQDAIQENLDESVMLPACGQGALGIECRTDDTELKTLLEPLNDLKSSLCVRTERFVNAALGGNCHTPLAVLCTPFGNQQLRLHAKVASIDGKIVISSQETGKEQDAEILAQACVQTLLSKGAAQLIASSRQT